MRKLVAVSLVLLSVFSLTACFGMTEVDEALYVLALGIDEGVADAWRVTIQYNTMKSGSDSGGESSSGGGGKKAGAMDFVSVEAPSFFAAVNILNTIIPRRVSFEHTQLVIFSEEIAKKGLLNKYATPLKRYYELRRSAIVCIGKGSVENIIKNNEPLIGKSVTKNFMIMHDTSKVTGLLPIITLETFFEGLKSSTNQAIAAIIGENNSDEFGEKGARESGDAESDGNFVAGKIPRRGSYKIEVCGTAVLKDEKLVTELSGDETRYLLMARGDFKEASITVDDPFHPKLNVPLRIVMNQKPRVKAKMYNSKPIIELDIMLDAEILAVQSTVNYESARYVGFLQEAARQKVKKGIEDVIAKCKRVNSDAFKFGDYARRNFKTIQELEEYNWNDNFANAEVFVDVGLFIRRTGELMKNYVPKT